MIEKKLTKVDSQSFNGIKGTIHLKESPVEPVEFPNRNENMDDSLNLKRSTQINFNNRFVQGLDGVHFKGIQLAQDLYNKAAAGINKFLGKGTKKYQAPPGGGGVTSVVKVGKTTVTFGHGARHLSGTNLSIDTVNKAIAKTVAKRNLAKGQFYKGRIQIGGRTIEYTSFGLGNGKINVGTYYTVD